MTRPAAVGRIAPDLIRMDEEIAMDTRTNRVPATHAPPPSSELYTRRQIEDVLDTRIIRLRFMPHGRYLTPEERAELETLQSVRERLLGTRIA